MEETGRDSEGREKAEKSVFIEITSIHLLPEIKEENSSESCESLFYTGS